MSTSQSSAVDTRVILEWLDEVREAAKDVPWSDVFDFDGVDALDVLNSPLYLAVLNAWREGKEVQAPAASRIGGRVRTWGHRLKTAWRERAAVVRSAPAGPTDFLFWPREMTHVNTMQAVAAAATERGDRSRLFACRPNIFAGLARYVPDPVYSKSAWPNAVRKARRDGARRAQRLASQRHWRIPSPPAGAAPNLEAVLRTTLIDHLTLAAESIANARAALEAFGPKVLVVGNDLTAEAPDGLLAGVRRKSTAVIAGSRNRARANRRLRGAQSGSSSATVSRGAHAFARATGPETTSAVDPRLHERARQSHLL
jgi:hypothetical protein